MSKIAVILNFLLFLILITLSKNVNAQIPSGNSNFTNWNMSDAELKEKVFQMMFEAQDRFRTDNYRKSPRFFDKDWEKCDETYRWPECCLWSDKKRRARGVSACTHIKGDVILENDYDAVVFQAFVGVQEIQGNLVVRNTTMRAFGMPHLTKIGFAESNPNDLAAPLVIENNPFLMQLRLRRLKLLAKHESQQFGWVKGNPKLVLDPKQYQIFRESSEMSLDFEDFRPPRERYIRCVFTELYPYFLYGLTIILIFTHHFIMLEVNESRMNRKEEEMIDCVIQMRDSTLAAELQIQTPSDQVLTFDKNVLHLCTDQQELIKQIQKLLEEEVQAFKDPELDEEFTPRAEF